jgi:glycosyltransferase involved in cell wall biosynthesis
MRLLMASTHKYPAFGEKGAGPHPRQFPSGSAFYVHDTLVKGLAELGHEVFYLLPRGADRPLPDGATLLSEFRPDVDILHTIAGRDWDLVREMEARRKPWVTTCHMDMTARGLERETTTGNWVFVSRTLAQLHGRDRYVLNGVDPAHYVYSETKDDYFLFMSTMDWGTKKGLDVVLRLSGELGFGLVVAGTGSDYESINRVSEMCRRVGARYVGDVKGQEKAELLAGARCFLFPTKVDEAFGLGMVEALMSGTPVICSDRGACPEVISAEVGFVCAGYDDYVAAVGRVASIQPRACRAKAMRDYHYLKMAAGYVAEYEKEVARDGE